MTLKRILHVEDDLDISAITRLALVEVGGFEVEQCEHGAQAIEIVPEFRPQLLLLDYMLPDLSGEQVWQKIKNLPGFEDLPAMFLTASVQKELAQQLIAKGALAVLQKPFDPVTLSNEIRATWDGR